jgi:microcystin-dependent protein
VAQPYVGEIRMFAGNFAPAGWMFCSGQLLPISEFETLFNLIGTNYGGDGQSTFALPDLQCRVPVHQGGGLLLAQKAGVETVTLTASQMAAHSHSFFGSTDVANSPNPGNSLVGRSPQINAFINANPTVPMSAQFLGNSNGGSGSHNNVQPFLCVSFIISLFGIFPTPT